MKLLSILCLMLISIGLEMPKNTNTSASIENKSQAQQLNITIGDKTFKATLYQTKAANELIASLPITLKMNELNGNEKYGKLPQDLNTESINPKTIHTGDLLLWDSDTLVLFYKTFKTSYNYTKIGKINNPIELQKAVGSGNIIITFTLDKSN